MTIQEVSLVSSVDTEDERRLAATYFEPENPNGSSVLFLGGYGGIRQRYMRYAVELGNTIGTSSLALDLGGHGESEGMLRRLRAPDHLDDALSGFDYLKSHPKTNPERIGVMGASYGGYIAVMLSRERNPKSMFLRAPSIHEALPAEFVREASDLHGEDFRSKLMSILPERSMLRPLSEYDGEITFVESERDQSVRPESIQACLMAAKKPRHEIIRGAGHVLNDEERLIFQAMLANWAATL